MTKTQKQIIIPSIVVMILLVIAIFPIEEYGYYILLRWIVCLTAIYITYLSKDEKQYWTWVMGIIALIFNPLIPLHLGKEIWVVVDFIAAIVFGINVFIFRGEREKEEMRE